MFVKRKNALKHTFVCLHKKGVSKLVNIDKIKTMAKNKGIAISFICEKLGKTRTYFNDVKLRGADIPENNLLVIADILDTTPEYLKDETDQKEKSPVKELSADDELVLKFFNSLTEEQKDSLLGLMRSMVEGQRRE